MTSVARKAVSGLGWVALSKYVTRLLGFVTTLVLAKLLVPEDFGLVALASLLINVLTIFRDLGLGQALIYRREETEIANSTAFVLMLVLNTLLFLIAVAVAPFAGRFYDNDLVTPVMILMSMNLIWIAFRAVPDALIRKNIDFQKLVIPDVVPILVAAGIGIYLAYQGWGVWSLVVKAVVADILGVAMIWRYTHFRPSLRFDLTVAKELLGYGKFIIGASIFAVMLYNVDRFYVSKIEGLASLGVYTLALTIANMPVSEFGHLVCRVIFPVFSKVNHDIAILRTAFLRTFRYNGMVTIPMSMGIIVWGPAAVRVFLGGKWAGIGLALQILTIAALLRSLSVIIHEVLRAQGNPKIVQRFIVYRLVLIGGLGVPALMFFGVPGLCVLMVVTYLTVLGWEVRVAHRQLGVTFYDLFRGVRLSAFLSLLLMPAVYALVVQVSGTIGVWTLMLGISLTIVLYLGSLYLLDRGFVTEIRQFLTASRQGA